MKTIRVGRGSQNDVVINDPVISTSHAIITISDFGDVFIEDLESKNGTFVNGKKIKKATLDSSSTVLLGNHSIDWKQIVRTNSRSGQKNPPVIPAGVVEKKLIGRNPMSQIRYSFDDVSDMHAYLCKKSNGEIVLVDNNSTNGTFVNGSRITSPYTLKKGDNVSVSGRHPLNWESVYPPKLTLKFNRKLAALVAASVASVALLIVGLLFLLPPNWSKVYAKHKNDVVLIYVKSAYAITAQGKPLGSYLGGDDLDYVKDINLSPGIARGTGTGFFISSDGKILTNRHVVGSSGDQKRNEEIIKRKIQSALYEIGLTTLAADIEVDYVTISVGIAQNDTHVSGDKDFIPCTVLKISDDPELDVAIMQTNTKSIPSGSTFVDLSKSVPTKKLRPGYGICTIGFPLSDTEITETSVGVEANNQSGEITQERGTYLYGHNITIHHGASGSPVYDKRGRFAGVIVSGAVDFTQGYNLAIHPAPVLEFVNKYIGK